jgi:hypothetical protein
VAQYDAKGEVSKRLDMTPKDGVWLGGPDKPRLRTK